LLASSPFSRGTNERSFKLLNNFIDHQSSLSEGKPEQPPSSSTIDLEFHIRTISEKKKEQEKGKGEEEVDFRFFKHQLRFLREDRERLSPSKQKLHLKKSLLALFIAAELPGIPTDIDLTGFSINPVSQITS
jgi:hypothetical protein